MNALVTFWLDDKSFAHLSDSEKEVLGTRFMGQYIPESSQPDWLEYRKLRGLLECREFICWDKKTKRIGLRTQIDFDPFDGFLSPDFMPDSVRFPIASVDATVFFFSQSVFECGRHFVYLGSDKPCHDAVLMWRPSKETPHGQYELFVRQVPDLTQLNIFIIEVLTGKASPKESW